MLHHQLMVIIITWIERREDNSFLYLVREGLEDSLFYSSPYPLRTQLHSSFLCLMTSLRVYAKSFILFFLLFSISSFRSASLLFRSLSFSLTSLHSLSLTFPFHLFLTSSAVVPLPTYICSYYFFLHEKRKERNEELEKGKE